MRVLSVGDVYIEGRRRIVRVSTATWAVAVEVQVVAAGRKCRPEIVACGINSGTEVARFSPTPVPTRPVRDPDIEFAECSHRVGAVVETEPVPRNRRVLVVDSRIDHRAEVDRGRPIRETL